MPLFFKLRNIICFFVLFATLPLFVQGQEISSSTMFKTVVIDAGHGGKDPGCISANRKYYEKNITLSVALKLGALIKKEY
ncbi:MAG: N-acetylmuramoyl-L-alanine amidase, partial [Bacteroidales bacterium]|nr:N-acetylmuramoyl-L-alanine amidase [Bacteroidales bacterium]